MTDTTLAAVCRELDSLGAEMRIAAQVLNDKGMKAFAKRLRMQAHRAIELAARANPKEPK